MKFTITQDIVNKSRLLTKTKSPPLVCPIALVIKEKLKVSSVAVTNSNLCLKNNHDDLLKLIPLPFRVRNFINYFDSDKKLTLPFEFELDI